MSPSPGLTDGGVVWPDEVNHGGEDTTAHDETDDLEDHVDSGDVLENQNCVGCDEEDLGQ